MTNITIPREALEAGHHAYYSEATTLEAAFLAMNKELREDATPCHIVHPG